MNCANPIATEEARVQAIRSLKLPMGLLGFEQMKDYSLIQNAGEEPFGWLVVTDNPGLAFVVVEPFIIMPDYRPDIPQPDVDFLGLDRPEDALLLNIVTLHGFNPATINLKGPLVLNRHSMLGKQVILSNAAEYSVQHPLPSPEFAVE